jgi:23S rRNA pseudouridine2605 synthase
MFEAVGHAVSRLIRIRYGRMVLPRGLKRGDWMELDAHDIDQLTRSAGAPQLGTAKPAFPRTAPVKSPKSGPSAGTKALLIGADSLARQRRDQKTAAARAKTRSRKG